MFLHGKLSLGIPAAPLAVGANHAEANTCSVQAGPGRQDHLHPVNARAGTQAVTTRPQTAILDEAARPLYGLSIAIRSSSQAGAVFGTALLVVILSQVANAQGVTGQAGVAAAVRGDVTLVAAIAPQPERVVGQALGSGDRIFLGDSIETGPESGMQIMLLDETIFTIGPSAGMVIDEFVYDPATSTGQVTASIVKGAFRFVSGRVAKETPQNMSVKTPLGTIGIRGTSAAGRVDPPDASGNAAASIVLLGPGPNNNAEERIGRIIVTNGGTSVEITRSGFGTVIGGLNQPPSPPVRFEPGQIAALTGGLGTDGGARPPASGSGQAADQGSEQNGGQAGGADNQGGSPASGNTPQTGGSPAGPGAGGAPIGLGQVNTLSGQNIGSGIAGADLVGQIGGTVGQNDDEIDDVPDASDLSTAIATFDQLRAIQTGTASLSVSNIPLNHVSGPHSNSGGSFNASISINFGARTLDFQVSSSNYFFNSGSAQSFAHNASAGSTNSYANDTGAVGGTDNSVDNSVAFVTAPSDGSFVTVTGAVLNDVVAGKIAAQGVVSVRIDNGTDVIAGGTTGSLQ